MDYASFNLREVKVASDDTMTFSGYGAVFGNMDSQGDVIVPGAFANTLSEISASGIRPAMLLNHGEEGAVPIGVWTRVAEDGHGLQVEGKLAKTPRGFECYELLKMDAITGLSIGYIAKKYELRTKPEDPRRKLTEIALHEVSLVTFPANGKARVSSVKSGLTIRDAEVCLRESGFSREQAKTIVAQGFKAINANDVPLVENVVVPEDVLVSIRGLIEKLAVSK